MALLFSGYFDIGPSHVFGDLVGGYRVRQLHLEIWTQENHIYRVTNATNLS